MLKILCEFDEIEKTVTLLLTLLFGFAESNTLRLFLFNHLFEQLTDFRKMMTGISSLTLFSLFLLYDKTNDCLF